MDLSKRLIALTEKLVSFKTVTGNVKETDKALTYVESYLAKNDLSMKRVSYNGYDSLIVMNHASPADADCVMHGHIDVVPADDNDFHPRHDKSRIYGRGALDMKGGLAVLIQIMKDLSKSSAKLTLLISSDEEKGGNNGTEKLIKELGYRGKFFITAEGEKQYVFKTEQKGVVMIKVSAQGKGDHSAYTWAGDNAVLKLFHVYNKIEQHFPVDKNDKDHWYSTVNLGKITGGLAVNSIPETAEAEMDIRFCTPYRTTKDILNILDTLMAESVGVSYKVMYMTDTMKTDHTNPLLNELNSLAKDKLKIKRDLYFKNHGTNDARFAAHVGIPSVAFGPVGDNYHAQGEYVSIQSLREYYEILTTFLSKQ